MEHKITFQLCLDNYNSKDEFINRNKSFLDVYQKNIGTFEDPILTDKFFEICKTNHVVCGDLIPPFFFPVFYEYDLSTLQDVTVLISEVRKIILNFKSESKMEENENYSKPTTLIIQYHQNKLKL